jgi:ribonucleoside-triphosphate reductase
MRSLEDIDRELAAAEEDLSKVEGTPTEVYSRIVGYYRSVRNWNKGKREEYGERQLFSPPENPTARIKTEVKEDLPRVEEEVSGEPLTAEEPAVSQHPEEEKRDSRLLLFVRPACPACPGAKVAAGRLGIPVDMVDADTEHGMAEAVRHQVLSTPTAILFARDGRELGRALDAKSISELVAV